MKRLSNYVLFIGLIMVVVSMSIGLAYRFTSLDLCDAEKSNVFTLYVVGAVMFMVASIYNIFKE